MNVFEDAEEEDFETVAGVIREIVKASPGLVLARSQCNHA